MELSEVGEKHDGNGRKRVWEGYADFRHVTIEINDAVNEAIEAFAIVQSSHKEESGIRPKEAATASARLLKPAYLLIPELAVNAERRETCADLLAFFQGGEDEEGGYVAKLSQTKLQEECPGWLSQYVLNIKQAAWELGYVKSGRWRDEWDDPEQEEVEKMFLG